MSVNAFQTSGSSPTRVCRIGILGFGTVGSAVARRLARDPATSHTLLLTHVFDRRAHEKAAALAQSANLAALAPSADGSPVVWTTCIDDLLASDVDIIVEAVGGTGAAVEWTRRALLAGKSVVTCNKQAVAHHGQALLRLAARQGRQLKFEAAVGGAMPIVRAVGEGLAGERINRLTAILNGTTNAVLSRMESSGCSTADALAEAQAHGYAEADPSHDLDGGDAAAKLAILCALAFKLAVDPAEIHTRSAAAVRSSDFDEARRRGGAIRQIALAAYEPADAALTAFVAPVIVPADSLFARTTGPANAAVINGAFGGDFSLSGAGAGGEATAVSVIGDLLAIARDPAAIVPAPVLSRPRHIVGLTAADRHIPLLDAIEAHDAGARVERFGAGTHDINIRAEAL